MTTPTPHPADDFALQGGRLVWAGPGEAPPYPGDPIPRPGRRAEDPQPAIEADPPAADQAPADDPQPAEPLEAPAGSRRGKGQTTKDGEA